MKKFRIIRGIDWVNDYVPDTYIFDAYIEDGTSWYLGFRYIIKKN